MPNDIESIIYGTVYSMVLAGVTNYNTAIASMTLTGCQPCYAPLDYRTTGRQQAKTSGQPSYYPQIKLIHTGGSEDKTVTPTFGIMKNQSCDAIVPITRTMDLIITYDAGVTGDNGTTPLETYINSAFHNQNPVNGPIYPTWGLAYIGLRFCRMTDRRRDETLDKVSRTVFRRSMTFDLWPHIAALQ